MDSHASLALLVQLRVDACSAAAAALAAPLGSGALSGLQYLYLDNNHIGDEGAVALANALRSSSAPVLKELHIWSNHIGDVGRAAFEDALAAQAEADGD